MFRGYNLRQRTVIDVNTAERIGYVSDVEFAELTGRISKIILRRHYGWWSGMFGIGEISVPWSAVTALGQEFVLVKSADFTEKCLKKC